MNNATATTGKLESIYMIGHQNGWMTREGIVTVAPVDAFCAWNQDERQEYWEGYTAGWNMSLATWMEQNRGAAQ